MSEARPAVKRARLDPQVIAAWSAVCARDAVPRRRLRTVFQLAILLAIGLCLLAAALKPHVPAVLIVAAGLAFAIAIGALIRNNRLVGKPACPACGESITLWMNGAGWSTSNPESLESCPHCFVWLKHPSDPHRPLT